MTKIRIRQATLDDEKMLIEIEKHAFNMRDAFGKRHIRYLLSNPHGSIISDVILWEEKVVGWACWMMRKRSTVVRLYNLALLPFFQGKGIAKEYLKIRLQEFAKTHDYCHLEVRISNERARALYTTMGFSIKERLVGYYGDEDGYRMRLRLRG